MDFTEVKQIEDKRELYRRNGRADHAGNRRSTGLTNAQVKSLH